MSKTENTAVQWLTISEQAVMQRVDNFLRTQFKQLPKSMIYRMLRKGEVRVNKKRTKPDYKLCLGDIVRVPPLQLEIKEQVTVPTQLNKVQQLTQAILYEDKFFLVLNKPNGMAVHGGSGLSYGVIEALRALYPKHQYLELVHRLDKETSGCLLIAKKRSALRALHEQLREHRFTKYYVALVRGNWPATQRMVDQPLHKNVLQSGERKVMVDHQQGKPCRTRFHVIESFDMATLIQAEPITGRTHQIRVHCQCVNHPIIGDEKYDYLQQDQAHSAVTAPRLFLHAKQLSFLHPETNKTFSVQAPLEPSLFALLQQLRNS